jgi:hypothetical protein
MFKVRTGQPVSCPSGHIVGRFRNDVAENEPIHAADFELDFGEKGVEVPDRDAAGHSCARCKRMVTKYEGGVFRVHTAGRWIS